MSGFTEQERQADGLRVIASVLDLNPGMPGLLQATPLMFVFWGDDAREQMAAAARAFPCKWQKKVIDREYGSFFYLDGQIGGIEISLSAPRDAVCRRVVTGTREVTETVKDPAKLAEVPEVEVTRTEETVEWICEPLLAGLSKRGADEVTA
jgi:hypothetical protein